MFRFENGKTPINDTNLNKMQIELLKIIFPVGSSYVTQEDTNPNTILGFGTWERSKGRVFVGLDENDSNFSSIGKTGGETTHTLTTEEIPKHTHDIENVAKYDPTSGGWTGSGTYQSININTVTSKETGGGQAHNNLQPYEVVGYMWIRKS